MDFETEKLEKIYRRSLDQFKNKPKMQALLASYGIQDQEVEVMFAQLIVLRDVDQAVGDALYKLGDMVGEPWKGQPVDEYRLAIKARIHANSLHARAEDILSLFTDHHMIDRKMKFSLRSRVAQSYDDAYFAWVYLQNVKGGAHGADYQYAGVTGDQHYQLDLNSKGSLFNTVAIKPPFENKFCCAVEQGRYIWFVPKESTFWLKLDVITDTYITYSKGFVGSLSFAVYDGVEYIWGVPDNSAYFVRISIVDGTVTTIAHGLTPEPQMFSHATLDDSGDYLIAVPYNADSIVRITLSDDSLSTLSYGPGNCAKFKYSLAGPDYVYCIPYNATHIIRLDPNPFAKTEFAHGETGSALWQKAIISGSKIFLSPYSADVFLYANLDLSSINKPTWDKNTGDTLVDCFLHGTRLIHVPGRHGFWVIQDPTTGNIVDRFRHTLPEDTDCAKRAVQHSDGTITGYGSIIDPYIIKFNPVLNQSRHAKVPFQANGNFLNAVGSINSNSDSLYWGPEDESSIVKINWQGSYGGIATQLITKNREYDNLFIG